MSQNDKAVVTAAVGYVFTAEPGTARPTPAQIAAIDPEAFGAQSYLVKSASGATSGTFSLVVGAIGREEGVATAEASGEEVTGGAATLPAEETTTAKSTKTAKAVETAGGASATAALPYNSGAAEVQAALEAVVGSGNVKVSGTVVGTGFTVAFVGTLHGKSVGLTVQSALLSGSTAVPVNCTVATAPNGWSTLGHTSRGDLPEFGFDGGDTEVRGTWQNENLREIVTKPIADYLTLFLQQFDTQAFELYYGKDASNQVGVFGVASGTVSPVEKALLIIIVDGDVKIGFYSPKASMRRDDSISLATDEFASLPVRATFLKHGSANKFEWINQDLFV